MVFFTVSDFGCRTFVVAKPCYRLGFASCDFAAPARAGLVG
ncbi:MAG: hypothetical protein RRY20_04105 [Bilophila sp.]